MWTLYSPLYSDLPEPIATALSSYVRLVRIAHYTEAEESFASNLEQHQELPLVCVERALGLLSQGRFSAARSFVDQAAGFGELEEDQRTLLGLIKGFATIGARGNLFPALCRTRELRAELNSIEWTDFSRFQVSNFCVVDEV